jgi:hypothetical protein
LEDRVRILEDALHDCVAITHCAAKEGLATLLDVEVLVARRAVRVLMSQDKRPAIKEAVAASGFAQKAAELANPILRSMISRSEAAKLIEEGILWQRERDIEFIENETREDAKTHEAESGIIAEDYYSWRIAQKLREKT